MDNHTEYSLGNTMSTQSPRDQQQIRLDEEEEKCKEQLANLSAPLSGSYCDGVWDNIMCWDPAPAGELVKMRCPDYIDGFSDKYFATRQCTDNGTWFINPLTNMTWTNYFNCVQKHNGFSLAEDHLPRIKLMYNIGYSLSLGSLVIAVFLLAFCRRQHTKSNTLHINLFLAFILRAFMSCLRESLFVKGVGLAEDVNQENGSITFKPEGTHWKCKLIYCLLLYGMAASAMWIFIEALYLHMLVYKTLFTERHGVQLYMLIGWLSPFLFLIPWIIVRIELENTFCWNSTENTNYQWIITGPLMSVTVINFFFFINFIRVLCRRVHANKRVTRRQKIRKLSRFILVTIPLFGVMYIITACLWSPKMDEEKDIYHMYVEMFYNSFQGLLLAIVFCFMDEEVHMEVRKCWYKYALSRHDSTMFTRTAMLSSWRNTGSHNSRAHSQMESQSETSLNDNLVRNYRNGVKKYKPKPAPNVRIRFQSSDMRNSRSSSNSSSNVDRENRYLKLEEAYVTRA